MCITGSSRGWALLWAKKRRPARKIMPCYEDRNNKLSELGMSYRQYLSTDEWKIIRAKVLYSRPLCLICHHPATQVHHTDYEWDTLLGTVLEALAPLCKDCHTLIEMKTGVKISLSEANRILLKLMRYNSTTRAWLDGYKKRYKEKQERDLTLLTNTNRRNAKKKKVGGTKHGSWKRWLKLNGHK